MGDATDMVANGGSIVAPENEGPTIFQKIFGINLTPKSGEAVNPRVDRIVNSGVDDTVTSLLSGVVQGAKQGLLASFFNTDAGKQIQKDVVQNRLMTYLSNPFILGGIILGAILIGGYFIKR